MTRRPFLAAVTAAAITILSAPGWTAPSLSQYAQTALRDLQVDLVVASKNDRELKKMGDGFVDAYSKLKDQELTYKEPNMVRFQARHGLAGLTRITNGNRQLFSYLIHRKVTDISKEPGKADAIIDIGVITPGWEQQVESEWLRAEKRGGNTLQVFSVYFKADRKARHTLWIDPDTKTVVEHIAHHRGRRKPGFKKRLVYSDVRNVNGVHLPFTATLYNSDNQVAAVMKCEKVRVNTGVDPKRFKI